MTRFHLDEHMATLVASALRQYGFDVTTPHDVGLLSADDPDHLAFAKSEGRVFVTRDDDLLRLHEMGVAHAGIAFCHANKYTARQLQYMLRLQETCFADVEMRGRVEYL